MIKNYIKLFFISFCITCFLSFTNAQCKLDSIYRYELEELKSKSIFYDDTINDQKIEIQWSWNPVFLMWKPSYKYISTVDSDENVLSRVKQNFITSFSNYSKDNWTYDSNGNMTSHVYQVWDTTLGDFINSVKRVYVYNVNNNRVLFLYQNWNFASETWENNYHIETGYNNLNKISELFQNWDNQNQVWENYNRSLNFVNDVNNNVLSFDVQSWNNIDSVWRTDAMYQVNYTYDNSNNVISEYKKYWDNVNQIWTNVDGRFETFYYDESNNQTYYRQEFWDTISSSWDTISIIHYTNAYDLYNNLISL